MSLPERTAQKLRLLSRFAVLNPCFLIALLMAVVLAWRGVPSRPDLGLDHDKTVEVIGWVCSFPEFLEESIYFEVQPNRIRSGTDSIAYPGRLAVYIRVSGESGPSLLAVSYGDGVQFTGYLFEPGHFAIPGVADYRDILWNRGVLHTVRLKSLRQLELLSSGFGPGILSPFVSYAGAFQSFLFEKLPESAIRLILSVFLGRKRILNDEDKERVRELGIFHLFVVSGFHVSLLVAGMHLTVGRFGILGRVAVLGSLWLYVFLTGASVPTLRAGIMTSFFYLVWTLGAQRQLLNCLGLTAILVLAVWPRSLFEAGFQFSFLSLGAIGFFVLPYEGVLRSLREGSRGVWTERVFTSRSEYGVSVRRVRFFIEETLDPVSRLPLVQPVVVAAGWTACYLGGLVLCGVMIQLFTFPLGLFYSNRFVWTQFMSNLVLIPLFSLFVPVCLVLFLLFWLPGSGLLVLVVSVLADVIDRIMGALQVLSHTTFLPQPGFIETLAYLLAFLLLFHCLTGSRRLILVLLPVVISSGLRLIPGENRGSLQITMLDVGQGESIHIRYPNGYDAVVDTGGFQTWSGASAGNFVGERLVSRYLWNERVNRLRYVLLSHPHTDHIQGLQFIRRVFPISVVYFHERDDSYSGLTQLRLKSPGRFVVGGVDHTVFHPELQRDTSGVWSGNEGSLVIRLTYGSFSILLTGDIEEAAERVLVEKLEPVTVLKAAHHGGRMSNSWDILKRLRPMVAIVSAGRRNSFGHPSAATVERFSQLGVPLLCTADLGSIRIETDGATWSVAHYSVESREFRAMDTAGDNESFRQGVGRPAPEL